ncbi:MAG: hypothetical protein CMH31_03875 [Micavibrio sp.]|nr:hypothetical protein [Micavibrio sp.]
MAKDVETEALKQKKRETAIRVANQWKSNASPVETAHLIISRGLKYSFGATAATLAFFPIPEVSHIAQVAVPTVLSLASAFSRASQRSDIKYRTKQMIVHGIENRKDKNVKILEARRWKNPLSELRSEFNPTPAAKAAWSLIPSKENIKKIVPRVLRALM